MKNKSYVKFIITLILPVILITSGCTKFDEPAVINSPDKQYSNTPVITNVSPAGEAKAGVREIVINGENFAVNGIDTNWVFIGGRSAIIKSIESNKIVVFRPPGDGIVNINVVIPSALGAAKIMNYNIEEPVVSFGDFSYQNYDLTILEVDKNENLFVATRRKILKLAPNGIDLSEIANLGSDFAKITDMKFGPNGLLYLAISKRDIYTVDPVTGASQKYVNIPKVVDRLDFDENKNIYTVRKDGIYVVNNDKTVTFTEQYLGSTILELRVNNGYVYVNTATDLTRNKILDSKGTLGATESVVNIRSYADLASCEISSFNFDVDGKLYLCLKNHVQYSVFVQETNGSITPFYKADILPRSVEQLVWGSSRYIYLNRGTLDRDSTRVYRMGMDRNGAPYLGR